MQNLNNSNHWLGLVIQVIPNLFGKCYCQVLPMQSSARMIKLRQS